MDFSVSDSDQVRDIPYNPAKTPPPPESPGLMPQIIPGIVPVPGGGLGSGGGGKFRGRESRALNTQVGQVEMLRHRISELQEAARHTFIACDVSHSTTWKRVLDQFPDLNRSDAQQLLRFLRWYGDPLEIFDKMPSPRRWRKIIQSLNDIIAEVSIETSQLSQAALGFDEQVCSVGGNFSQACKNIRQMAQSRNLQKGSQDTSNGTFGGDSGGGGTSAGWVSAAHASLGILVGTMYCIHGVRQSPENHDKTDHFLTQSLIEVTGSSPKLPLLITYGSAPYALPQKGKPTHRATQADHPAASIWPHGTSAPMPKHSVIHKDGSNAIVVADGWEQADQPLNITVFHHLPEFGTSPLSKPIKRLATNTHLRYPTQQYILDQIVPEDWVAKGEIGFESVVSKAQPSAAPWHNRLRADVTTERFSDVLQAPNATQWPRHSTLFESIMAKTGWDLEGHVLIRHTLPWPIPLSYCTGYIQF